MSALSRETLAREQKARSEDGAFDYYYRQHENTGPFYIPLRVVSDAITGVISYIGRKISSNTPQGSPLIEENPNY